jgi:hypothetical protein
MAVTDYPGAARAVKSLVTALQDEGFSELDSINLTAALIASGRVPLLYVPTESDHH